MDSRFQRRRQTPDHQVQTNMSCAALLTDTSYQCGYARPSSPAFVLQDVNTIHEFLQTGIQRGIATFPAQCEGDLQHVLDCLCRCTSNASSLKGTTESAPDTSPSQSYSSALSFPASAQAHNQCA